MTKRIAGRIKAFESFHRAPLEGISPQIEKEAARARRAEPRQLQKRTITVGRERFVAFDADALIEYTTDAVRARPGHVNG